MCIISALLRASGVRLVTKQLWKQAIVFIIQKQHWYSCDLLAALILQGHVDVPVFKAFYTFKSFSSNTQDYVLILTKFLSKL